MVGLVAGLAASILAIPVQAGSASSLVVGSGTFEGRSNHVTTDGTSVLATALGHVAVLEPKDGLRFYELPANKDPAALSELYVCCAKFRMPLHWPTQLNSRVRFCARAWALV